jgi:hypothetical protein
MKLFSQIPHVPAALTALGGWLVTCLVSTAADGPGEWQRLFNGTDFTGIDRYLAAPAEGEKPYGLNHDPKGVFTIETVDGRGAIHVTGEVYGALTTKAEFGNAHFRVQYKWGAKKWPPRAEPRHYRDAGLLYWCIGPDGAGSGAWQRSVECNIMEKGVGQWWSVAGTYCDTEGRNVVLEQTPQVPYRGEGAGEKCVIWEPGGPRYTVKPYEGITSLLDPEKPHGEWNTAEVYAWGNTCIHLLNGQVVLVVTNPRFAEGGREQRLSRGRVQLQSEAAELYYRDFEARTLDALPPELWRHIPAEPAEEAGFQPLLTEGAKDWKQCGPGSFVLKDGVATGRSGMGLWWYAGRTYTNFVLRGEWRQLGPKSDSGIFFRFPDPGTDPWIAVRQGHEFEIGEAAPAEAKDGTGSFYPFRGPKGLALRPTGEWNQYELSCIGPNYTLRINGRVVNVWTDTQGRPLSGYIGLQNYDYPEAVQHRNLRIKELL